MADFTPVWGYLHSAIPRNCFLLADLPTGTNLGLNPPQLNAPIMSLKLARPALNGVTTIYSPRSGRFLRAHALTDPAALGRLDINAETARHWEHFKLDLHPVPVGSPLEALVGLLSLVSEAEGDPECLLRLLRLPASEDVARVLNAVARLYTYPDIDKLAKAFLQLEEPVRRSLRDVFPNDLYAKLSLPRVTSVILGASPSDRSDLPEELPQSLDELDSIGIDGEFTSLPYTLNAALRRLIVPKQRACVIATARNEGLYVLEWVAYHQVIGFEKIFIYSNSDTDGSDDLLRALHRSGQITWIKNHVGLGRRPQWKAYGHALRVSGDALDYDWALIIDLDEFFVPDSSAFGDVSDFLGWHERRKVDAIASNWLLIGANSQVRWRDDLLAARFLHGSMNLRPAVKTMCRPRKFVHSLPHHPIPYYLDKITCNAADGIPHLYDTIIGPPGSVHPSTAGAVIVHFHAKSIEELLWKSSRTKGDHPFDVALNLGALDPGLINEFTQIWHSAGDTIPTTPWLDKTRERVAYLTSLPGVAVASNRCKQRFKDGIGEIIALARGNETILSCGEAGRFILDSVSDY